MVKQKFFVFNHSLRLMNRYFITTGTELPQQEQQFQNPKSHYVTKSVYAFAHALDRCYRDGSGSCNISAQTFVTYLKDEINKNTKETYKVWKYRIKTDGHFGYESLLDNENKCDLNAEQNTSCLINTSIDAGSCPDDQIWTRSSYGSNCARRCHSCPKFTRKLNEETCRPIGIDYNVKNGSNSKRETLYPLDHELDNDWTPLIIFLWVLTIIGLVCVLIVAVIFFKFRKTPVVLLSHGWRPLLIGLAILFLDTFVELERPSTLVCTFRRFVLGIGLTTVYGVLFVRGFSRYRILHELLEERKSHIAQVKMQRLIFSLLLTIQLLISVVWCMIKSPDAITDFKPKSDDPGMLKCNTDEIARFFTQAYNFILITITTFFAIRTRNIPCAFGEAKWTFYAMLSNWVVGLAFAISHYTNLNNYPAARVSLSVTTILSSFLILFLLALPKLYILLIKPERNVMCDDLEELEHSVYDESQTDAGSGDKNVPKIKVGNIESEPDLIQKAESKDKVQTERQQSETKQPEDKLLTEEEPKDIIVHSPE